MLAVASTMTSAAADAPLSPVATRILARLEARPDINVVCKSDDQLKDAVRETVRGMIMSGEVQGRPKDDARAAALVLKSRCGTF
jgi:hypothetical protein